MKKFTLLDTYKKDDFIEESFESRANKIILENLSIETTNIEEVSSDFKIVADTHFYENLQKLVNNIFINEKIEFLEKSKNAIFRGDISWIEDELEKLKK